MSKNEELCPQNFRDANEVLNNTSNVLPPLLPPSLVRTSQRGDHCADTLTPLLQPICCC
jgi:hypothetical protein